MNNKESLIQDLASNGKGDRSWDKLAKLHGFSTGDAARHIWRRNKKVAKIAAKQEVNNYISDLEDKVISLEEDLATSKAELLLRSKDEVRTLEELVEKTKIDLTKYKIVRWRQNYWGNANDPHWQVRVELEVRKLDTDPSLQKSFLLDEIKKWQENQPKSHWDSYNSVILRNDPTKEKYLLEISIPDLHIGKLAWREEAGEDYDSKIAVERFDNAINTLVSRAPMQSVERILFPIGNDLIHIDNSENQTTAGTVVDADSRFAKIVKTAKKTVIEAIDKLKQIAPIDVVIICGNHDSTTTFLLGEIIEAWFHADPLVTVNVDATWRKYYQYGNVGIMYTHGDKEPHEQLGLIFATEKAQLWADTKYRFCKVGHLHKSKKLNYLSVDTYQGFQVQVLPSLSGTDEWHSAKGYLSNKQAKAFLYHKTEGEVAEYTYTV